MRNYFASVTSDSSTLPAPASGRDALAATGRDIRHERVLKPWMLAYAEWLQLECTELPTRTNRRVRARALARAPISNEALKVLEERDDFVKYMDELAKGPLEAARAKFASAFPSYVEAHAEALHGARLAGDYSAIARIAEPVLDRIIPRKVEGVVAPASVTIILTPQQAAGIATYRAPAITVEAAEVVSNE